MSDSDWLILRCGVDFLATIQGDTREIQGKGKFGCVSWISDTAYWCRDVTGPAGIGNYGEERVSSAVILYTLAGRLLFWRETNVSYRRRLQVVYTRLPDTNATPGPQLTTDGPHFRARLPGLVLSHSSAVGGHWRLITVHSSSHSCFYRAVSCGVQGFTDPAVAGCGL